MKESESTQDTQEKKLVEDNILIMDLVSLPINHGLDIDKWSYLIREQGVLFYDSSNGGDAPTFQKEDTTIKMYDVADEEAMAELEKIMAEDNYETAPSLPALNIPEPITEEESVFIDGVIRTTANIEPPVGVDLNDETRGSTRYVSGTDLYDNSGEPLSIEQFEQVMNPMGTLVLENDLITPVVEEVIEGTNFTLTDDTDD